MDAEILNYIRQSLADFKTIEKEMLPKFEGVDRKDLVFASWTSIKHTMDWAKELIIRIEKEK